MRYRVSARFDRSLHRLDSARKTRVKDALDRLVAAFETGDITGGLGLKQLRPGVWELRAGLADRVLFLRSDDPVEFLIVGHQDEIRRVLRSL